ncbi:SAM-dependent methyltransferase [Paenibacillus sp. TAB 01]|uniref:SAM-dependent methyltransferase n=1 Tax=Paenibacillus sp. TAB 01 TaxID=3368988 RepID=UPI003752045B
MDLEQFHKYLVDYRDKFVILTDQYDGTMKHGSELEKVIDAYSAFILDEGFQEAWTHLEEYASDPILQLAEELRKSSALCVSIMEKYRALRLLNEEMDRSEYFRNIETCIEQEFGSFQVTADSKVILVGSGSFPMTPLYIAKQTGAEVIGIDIDMEAIELGKKVIESLGNGLNIRLEGIPAEQLEAVKGATHIIFSSTVSVKYDLLDRLHPLTNRHVVVAMRYGNHLKSLFNYPMEQVDETKWRLVETVLRPDQVFDIALYQKA